MDGKISIITGATSGVGYHAARRLAQGGASLVLVCRDEKKAEELRKELSDMPVLRGRVSIKPQQALPAERKVHRAIERATAMGDLTCTERFC